jgi:hypothetical protein
MEQQSNISHGLKWGLIIGVVYVAFSYVRYAGTASNPILMSLLTIVGYAIALALLVVCGLTLRKKNGGLLDVKEAFKILFLAVLIFELFYSIFNFVYVKYIDPHFYETLKANMAILLEKSGQPQAKTDEMLKSMDVDTSKMNVFDLLKTYLVSISVSGIIALIIAVIIKKKPVPTPTKGNIFP